MHYEEHPSKATRWRDGKLHVLPAAKQADSTVWFSHGPAGPDSRWEGLLARRRGEESAVICAVPFWIYDLSLGDEVAVIPSAEGPLVATGLRHHADAFTFRVSWTHPHPHQPWLGLMQELESHDCWFDVRSESFLALSAPGQHAQAVADYLAAQETRGSFQYETGRTAA